MYDVSEEFKAAMKRPVQRHFLKGTVGEHEFNEKNILSGSFTITNQCSGNDAVEIGQVYTGELSATFLKMPLTRYQWKGKEIKPYFGLKLSDGSTEYIPLGVFTIDTAEWTETGVVVKAYDHMALLDKTCNKVLTEVTPYECMKRIESETKVTFANSEEDFESFPNGTIMVSENTTNDVETWRDMVSWLAQTIGCFATADREGNIVFRAYTDEAVDTIDTAGRFTGASFSDYVTRYTGVSVTNMADNTTSYYGLDVDDGLTMNLGSNPFLQYGLSETKEQMARSILDGLQKIRYVPFKVKMIGNPAYDLGDVIVFKDGLADGNEKSCITKFVFKFHGEYEITGVGKDPALASARSKVDKDISGLISNTDENVLVHYQFVNTKSVQIADGKQETIASIRFATSSKDSDVTLWAEVLPEVTINSSHNIGDTKIREVIVSDPPGVTELQEEMEAADAAIVEINERMTAAETAIAEPDRMTVTVSYMLNGDTANYHPVETYSIDGKHVLGLHYYIGSVKANTVYTFTILMQADGGTVYLDGNTVNALLTGMGLAGTGHWDGTFNVEDELKGITFSDLLGGIKDSVMIRKLTQTPVKPEDTLRGLTFASLLKGFTDKAGIETADE